MRKGRRLKCAVGCLVTVFALILSVGGVLAAEDRTPIEEINLIVDSTIEAGSSKGRVSVTTSDSSYRVGSVQILNNNDDWQGGMTPRAEVMLYAHNGYYFGSSAKKVFHFSGDDAAYVTARREDDRTAIALTIKLDKLDNGDLSIDGASWNGDDGTVLWNENPRAKYYQVKLYRDNTSVMGIRTTYEAYYNFAGYITRQGNYYFTVRAVGSGSEKGDWSSSDSWYVSAREANNISDRYNSKPDGGFGSGGPGVSQAAKDSHESGAITSTGGNHWCEDQGGRWYQYSDGSYPVDCWVLIDNKYYCFGQTGYIRCGWIEWGGKWYYTGADGIMLVNARTPDNYFVGGDGAWIP